MKSIIIDINELSDSKDLYESKPNKAIHCFIWFIALSLFVGCIWAYYFKMDVVVKANGTIMHDIEPISISAEIAGSIEELYIEDGDLVEKGQPILKFEDSTTEKTILQLNKSIDDLDQRIEILEAFNLYLSDFSYDLSVYKDNKYYEEFQNKKNLMDELYSDKNLDITLKASGYEIELENIISQKQENSIQLNKINQALDNIQRLENTFTSSDAYYKTLISSYISNYIAIQDKFDTQISLLNLQLSKDENRDSFNDCIGDRDLNLSSVEIDRIKSDIEEIEKQKIDALYRIKLDNLLSLEQEKKVLIDKNISLDKSLELINRQKKLLKESNSKVNPTIIQKQEIQNIFMEINNSKNKKQELEYQLGQLEEQLSHATLKSKVDGYAILNRAINKGSYINKSENLINIIPNVEGEYMVRLFIRNRDIGKITLNQSIKFDIPTSKSSSDKSLIGTIQKISRIPRYDERTGETFYTVTSKITKNSFLLKEMKNIYQLPVQGKIIVDTESILKYVTKKLNISN